MTMLIIVVVTLAVGWVATLVAATLTIGRLHRKLAKRETDDRLINATLKDSATRHDPATIWQRYQMLTDLKEQGLLDEWFRRHQRQWRAIANVTDPAGQRGQAAGPDTRRTAPGDEPKGQ